MTPSYNMQISQGGIQFPAFPRKEKFSILALDFHCSGLSPWSGFSISRDFACAQLLTGIDTKEVTCVEMRSARRCSKTGSFLGPLRIKTYVIPSNGISTISAFAAFLDCWVSGLVAERSFVMRTFRKEKRKCKQGFLCTNPPHYWRKDRNLEAVGQLDLGWPKLVCPILIFSHPHDSKEKENVCK